MDLNPALPSISLGSLLKNVVGLCLLNYVPSKSPPLLPVIHPKSHSALPPSVAIALSIAIAVVAITSPLCLPLPLRCHHIVHRHCCWVAIMPYIAFAIAPSTPVAAMLLSRAFAGAVAS